MSQKNRLYAIIILYFRGDGHRGFMKALRIVVLSVLSIFVAGYLAFLFVLPYAIDLNTYSPQITKTIQRNTGLNVTIKGLKVRTAWNLSAGALIDKTDLKYPEGQKFAQINNMDIKLSLIPLLWGQIQLDKISADKILANLDVNDKGEFLLQNYLDKNSPSKNGTVIGFSDSMPDITAKEYRISLLQDKKDYTIKGEDLKISDFVLNKKIKIKTKGNLILNNRKQISYDIFVYSKTLHKAASPKAEKTNIIKIFGDLYKYNINADVSAHLSIKDKKDDTEIKGNVDIDKISLALGHNIYPIGNKVNGFSEGQNIYPPPLSNLKLDFKGDDVGINSHLYTDNNSKAVILGNLKRGKNKFINLKVKSDANLKNVVLISNTVLKMFGRKDLENTSADGLISADFSIKSDFKRVKSAGYLKIKDANITNKSYKVSLNSVNADVDFSQDAVNIRQATANLNNQPIIIKGTVDRNANADISVLADKLQLKGVLLAAGQGQILKDNTIINTTGANIVDVKASLKGPLDKASPKINVLVSNINFVNNPSKARVKIQKIVVKPDFSKQNKGKAEIIDLKIIPNAPASIAAAKINLAFDDQDLSIEKTPFYINNIKTNLEGHISNLNSTPILNPVTISTPSEFSMPIQGYDNSRIVLKADIKLSGDITNPKIEGGANIPLISIPPLSFVMKNTILHVQKDIFLDCPWLQIANSTAKFNARIDSNFSNGINAKSVNLTAGNLDLNTLSYVFRNMRGNQNSNITISNAKASAARLKTGDIVITDINNADATLKNNILHFSNIMGNAYFGKVGGNVYYDFKHNKTSLDIQGRGLSAGPALIAVLGNDNDIHGQLDFDTNLTLSGYSKEEITNNLKGNTNFIISNGQMGALGKFEHLLYAQNIISNNVFRATLNLVAKAITVKNTGVYKYMKGKITFSRGWANITYVKTSGPSMSLYMTGRYYIPGNLASLTILGRISDDVVRILGPIGEFSMDKVISSIPKLGEISSSLINQYTINPYYENTSQIPYLTPRTELPTKEFKVVIDGDVSKQSSVKSFKWLSSPKAGQATVQHEVQPQKPTPTVPDFVKNLPDLRM